MTRVARPLRIVIALLLIVAAVFVVMWVLARPLPAHPFVAGLERPIVFAHAGGDRLWPGNTLYAFERANELGVDVLEMDLHTSSDGHLVVIHDDTVDRTTDGSGAVNSLTLEQLKELDAAYDWSPERTGGSFPYRGMGIEIPTLEEIFEAFPDTALNLEIKQSEPPMAVTLCQAIRDHGRSSDVMVGSFHDNALREFREACPEVATSAGPNEVTRLFVLSTGFLGRLYDPAANALQVPEERGSLTVVTPRFVRDAQRKGVQVHVWTPNERAEFERLLAMGVDGIITDRPDRLLQMLGRGGEIELPDGVPR